MIIHDPLKIQVIIDLRLAIYNPRGIDRITVTDSNPNAKFASFNRMDSDSIEL